MEKDTSSEKTVIYPNPRQQIEIMTRLNQEHSLGIPDSCFERAFSTIPSYDDFGRSRKNLLVWRDLTVAGTFEKLLGAVIDKFCLTWMWEEFSVSSLHLPKGITHEPGLNWCKFKTYDRKNKTPSDVFSLKATGAGVEVLMAALMFPAWFKFAGWIWMTGLEYHHPNKIYKGAIPLICYNPKKGGGIKLGINPPNHPRTRCRAPTVIYQ